MEEIINEHPEEFTDSFKLKVPRRIVKTATGSAVYYKAKDEKGVGYLFHSTHFPVIGTYKSVRAILPKMITLN